jgi:nicotinate phosphoribosyltransferase
MPGGPDGLDDLYGGCSLALLTDLYQLTMAYGYWKSGHGEREAVFHVTFRRPPFGGGYAIAAGTAPAVAFLERLRFSEADVDYLATLTDPAGARMFPADFLAYLRAMKFTCAVDVVPEGHLVFAHEPIVRVRGPIIQAQLVETALLTIINFQTLIATKAARVVMAARDAPVLEFGLRRAQGIDGGVAASRAAYIGGCAATSNLLAGRLLGIPVKGTHAHSYVMFHRDEVAAFRDYARAMPGNCTFLVDTYDTLAGVAHAIEVGRELRAAGHELLGVRLDSGDLAYLSIEARKLLDAAGFSRAQIFASNDLDETLIASLYEQGAQIDAFGVGTKLVTAYDQPALGGVYKLGAVRDAPGGGWRDVIKLSEQPIKISNPGVLQVRRLRRGDELVGDVIYDSEAGVNWPPQLYSIDSPAMPPVAPAFDSAFDLLVPALVDGKRVLPVEPLATPRARAIADLAALSPRSRRVLNPQPYPVGLDRHVHDRKLALIAAAAVPAKGAT